ncbi:hypothetical protein FMEXI_14491 [Fusarium mexicanum]|uniref:Uncharacterized protein n=1 Tax=Fusarium mexicanum TaxID=751941 RepID=A0A8H5I3U2_9HYPO|nr:hypothetical protein FMEXI_14491 [Fusarium mexicanum]
MPAPAEPTSPTDLPVVQLELSRSYTSDEIRNLQDAALKNETVAEVEAPAKREEQKMQKREILHATLNAKINFYCPNLRNTRREFEWVSYWYSQSNRMDMVGTKNVDGFRNFSFNPASGTFAGYWYHSFCQAQGDKICTYNVQSYFTGKKYTHFTVMEMVTDTSNGANILAPVITENCVDLRASGNSCPSVSATHCTITSISVTVP